MFSKANYLETGDFINTVRNWEQCRNDLMLGVFQGCQPSVIYREKCSAAYLSIYFVLYSFPNVLQSRHMLLQNHKFVIQLQEIDCLHIFFSNTLALCVSHHSAQSYSFLAFDYYFFFTDLHEDHVNTVCSRFFGTRKALCFAFWICSKTKHLHTHTHTLVGCSRRGDI